MSPDLHTQLADYGRYQRAARQTVDLDAIRSIAAATQSDPPEGELIMVDIQTREPDSMSIDEVRKRRRVTQVLVAAAAVIVVVVAVALFDDAEQGLESDRATQVGQSPSEAALATSETFVDAFNDGDDTAMLDTLTPDAAVSEKYTSMSDGFAPLEPDFFEQHLAWATAQGASWSSPECAIADEAPDGVVDVTCTFGWLNAAKKASGAAPLPTTLTLVVTAGGISRLAFEYPPFFGVNEFDNWVSLNRRDDSTGVGFGDWSSVAQAEQGGLLLAQYVEEWIADGDPNG